MATLRCPRCTRPLTGDRLCRWCGPAVTGLLPAATLWPGEPAWPQARRWLDDVPARRDRRPLLAAACCLAVAVLLAVLAFA